MTRDEFVATLRGLSSAHSDSAQNQRCVQCNDCTHCFDSTFCQRSKGLLRCHYCTHVNNAVECTHCHNCEDMMGCTHCKGSSRCLQSAYLEHCLDCSSCQYCFGCVGIHGRDFHILNEPYSRSDYFKITSKLKKSLRGQSPLLLR